VLLHAAWAEPAWLGSPITCGGWATHLDSYPDPIPLAVVLGAVRSFHGITVVVFLSPLSHSHLSLSWAGIFVFAFVFVFHREHWAVRVRCYMAFAVLRGAKPSSRVAGDESRFSEVYSTRTNIVGIPIYNPSHFLAPLAFSCHPREQTMPTSLIGEERQCSCW
jgi:hypothetical protein